MARPFPVDPLSIVIGVVLGVSMLAGCEGGPGGNINDESNDSEQLSCVCNVPSGNCEDAFVDSGAGRNGIPALCDPPLTGAEEAHLDQGGYLADSSRVIGLVVNGKALAVPHNIQWHHEIVNLHFNGKDLAVTYCPLTGSALAFDRSSVDGANFIVSGLLFKNNLVMLDETSDESLWAQMSRQANCGPKAGASQVTVPVIDIRWDRWRELHPDTRVIAENTGFDFPYTPDGNRYSAYEQLNNDHLFVPMPIDERRPPKERVLGIPHVDGSLAFPFQDLAERSLRAIETTVGDRSVVVFWSRSGRAAMAYEAVLNGNDMTFEVRNGKIIDTNTESTWTVTGRAIDGPMAGEQLTPIPEAYSAFWFAWATFEPDTNLWTAE